MLQSFTVQGGPTVRRTNEEATCSCIRGLPDAVTDLAQLSQQGGSVLKITIWTKTLRTARPEMQASLLRLQQSSTLKPEPWQMGIFADWAVLPSSDTSQMQQEALSSRSEMGALVHAGKNRRLQRQSRS